MKPQKTTSCQIYAEKKQNWKLHIFCFLNILKSNSHMCFEKKIHRNHSGLNARSSSVRKEKRGEGREQHFQGDFQGSEWYEWSPSQLLYKSKFEETLPFGKQFQWLAQGMCVCVCSFILWKQERIPSLLLAPGKTILNKGSASVSVLSSSAFQSLGSSLHCSFLVEKFNLQ